VNEALRLLRKLVRRWGYDLKASDQYLLRPVPHIEDLPHGLDLRAVKIMFDQDHGPSNGADLDRLTVYLRTCVRPDRNIDKRPRLTGATDEENALRCLASTVTSINDAATDRGTDAIDVVVLDDRSALETLEKFKQVLAPLTCSWQIIRTKEKGQGPSLHEQFSRARPLKTLIYFCEDDYLHEPVAIRDMWQFYDLIHQASGGHCVIYPQEHKNLYEGHYPSYIFAGPTRRWRTMSDATHTFFTHAKVVDTYWDYFENTKYVGERSKKRHLATEKVTTNRLYEHIPGFSPIPPVAVHLQFEELLPPLFDWRPLWDANKVDL